MHVCNEKCIFDGAPAVRLEQLTPPRTRPRRRSMGKGGRKGGGRGGRRVTSCSGEGPAGRGGSVGENWIEHEMEDEMEHEFILLYDHYEIEKLRENQIVALFSIF